MADPGQLYIRWSQTGNDDNRTDPGAATWWSSKSVGLFNPANPLQDAGQAITGVPQKIRVNIDTLLGKSPVGVQAWVCAYGTAGQPLLPSAFGAKGLKKDLDDQTPPQAFSATHDTQLTIDIPWTPDAGDLTSLNLPAGSDLLVSILANCYATPPAPAAADGQEIPTQATLPPIDVPHNRHHAKHNLVLRGVAAGAGGMAMNMFAGNPAPEGEEVFELEVTEVHTRCLDPELVELALNSRWGPRLANGAKLHLGREPVKDLHLEIGGECGARLRVPLAADEPQVMTLGFKFGPGETNALRAFEVVQRRHRDRQNVGGARLVTLGVPDSVFEELTATKTVAA
jgi:hypothetical protein